MKSPNCPPVRINVDAIVEASKRAVLAEVQPREIEASVNSVHMKGLLPTKEQFNGSDFFFGYATIPSVVNFASKLAHENMIFPRIDKALFRSVATGVSLGAQLVVGGSFFLGSLIGQIPTTLDALADMAVDSIKAKRLQTTPTGPASPSTKGIGAAEDELISLRRDLERMGDTDDDDMNGAPLYPEREMRGVMVVD